jgi:hypothetical protein
LDGFAIEDDGSAEWQRTIDLVAMLLDALRVFHAPTADTQRLIITPASGLSIASPLVSRGAFRRFNRATTDTSRLRVDFDRVSNSISPRSPARFDLVGAQDGTYSGRAEGARRTLMNPETASSVRTPRDNARGVESLLWLAAGAAWAIVALKAWSQSQKTKSRQRTFSTSERLLKQVFPNGIRH